MTAMTFIETTVGRSKLAQRVYGLVLDKVGRYHLRADRRYQALDACCRALRQLPSSEVTRHHVQILQMIVRDACFGAEGLLPLAENRLLREYPTLSEASRIQQRFAAQPLDDRVRLRWHREDDNPARQGNLILLKRPDPSTAEKGVLLLKYNPTFAQLPAVFDLETLGRNYRMVLEPSWKCNIEAAMFLYVGSDTDVVVQCNNPRDFEFFEHLKLNFRPIRMGAGGWVDLDAFKPNPSDERDFDLIMVASWARWKRHQVLFRALARLRPRRYRVALVGYPHERARGAIEQEMRAAGVADQCEIFEAIPPAAVAELLGRSKVALMLSKAEGANKGVYEAFACDTPAIVYRHNLGFNLEDINSETGILADDHELPHAISWMVENHDRFHPRQWSLNHVGYQRSTSVLNETLRTLAEASGEPWTSDLVPKLNQPNLKYQRDADRLAMEPAYRELERWLRA